MKKIKILIIEPNKEPYVAKIKNTLEEKQKIVEGLVYFYDIECNVDLIWNEEGKVKKLPVNRIIEDAIIFGNIIIAGQCNGESISLSRKQIKKYKRKFKLK